MRTDQDPGISFPVLEAAACGVPCIATNGGIDHLFTEAGGGILIEADEVNSYGEGRSWYIDHVDEVGKRFRNAIIWMRDHPEERKEMGRKAREEVMRNWTWEKLIPAWREFFREGIQNVRKN
jgi:glycosyltransferase involved in cell wall biosynthesis